MRTPVRALAHTATARLDRLVGGPARRHVVVVLACVLALDSADKATVGANATQLQAGLSISKTDIGLLLTVTGLVGAAATIPAGIFVDRMRRTRLLAAAVLCWAVAMALSALATGFVFLLLARVGLGVVTALAGPAIASLIGDYFPERERGKIYGYVLSGELIGAGFGFVVAGELANLSWRAPFLALAIPSAGVWWLVHRLPEPARGGPSRMPAGATQIRAGDAIATGDCAAYSSGRPESGTATDDNRAHELARSQAIEPRREAVLASDPERMPLIEAVRYVLRVRTNVVLIVASALGYFFFSGLRGFAVEFAKQHYGVSQSVATSLTLVLGIGALIGVLSGGRLADRLLRHGRLTGRVEVPGAAVLVAALLFIPALVTSSIWIAVPLLTAATLFLGAANPPLDAARLDIIHPRMWGRAEAVRTVLRNCADALAPVLFGFLSGTVFGASRGLEYTFLLSLITLFAAAVIVLTIGRRTYPRDVAAAAHSLQYTGARTVQ
ncbi:MAG: MFS transporter [Jatrophihabitantaceae bacterium]